MDKYTVQAIILAAGKSTRLKTGRNKLIEKICGQPMIAYSTKLMTALDIPTTVVIGHQGELIKKCIEKYDHDNITFIHQENQYGTAHALLCTQEIWNKDHIFIMNGDMPLVTPEIIHALYKKHMSSDATISFVIAHNIDPNTSYGRIIKHDNKIRIVEAQEFSGDTSEHCCINAGIYLVKKDFLEKYIHAIEQNETSKEFHVTDLVAIASKQGCPIETISAPFDYIRGINNQHELWAAEQIQRSNIIKYWMEHGVRFSVAHNVHIDLDVTIGPGTYIGCGVHLLFGTKIGNDCKIHEYTSLEGVTIGDHTRIFPFTIIKDSIVGNNVQLGPFAHIKEQTIIENEVVVGNFVEIKKSVIGAGTKAKHLTYLGDAHVGKQVNIGAGTITCNFDGRNKHATTIDDRVFIGSNNTLIAPLKIGSGAYIAGGSTINQDVPKDALAIGRSRQTNKPGYAKNLLQKNQEASEIFTNKSEPHSSKKKASFMGAVRTSNDTFIENEP